MGTVKSEETEGDEGMDIDGESEKVTVQIVDASGTLPDGRAFNGSAGLKAILRANRDDFARCLTEKMMTYALGRGLETYDRPAVAQICRKMATSDYRFSSLVLGIVNSLPFQNRRGEAAVVAAAVKKP